MSIKLFATDLDGTLLKSNHQPPEEFFDWVKRHPEIRPVIASGRQYQTLVSMFGELGDRMIYCSDNGGFIFHKGEKLYSNPLRKNDIYHAIRYMGSIPDTCLVLSGAKTCYIEKTDEETLSDVSMYFTSFEVVDDLNSVVDKDEIVKSPSTISGIMRPALFNICRTWENISREYCQKSPGWISRM